MPTISTKISFGGKSCIMPMSLRNYTRRLGITDNYWGKANSYTCPVGQQVGIAWVLLKREDTQSLIDLKSTHSMVFEETTYTTDPDTSKKIPHPKTMTVEGLTIVNAYNLTMSPSSTVNSIYLVEAHDIRHELMHSTIDKQYNVRMPAGYEMTTSDSYDPNQFYQESLDDAGGGIHLLWTWQTLLDDLWSNLPTVAGNAPLLSSAFDPGTDHRYPDNFRLIGMLTWDAIHMVLGKLGCTTVFDPTVVPGEPRFSYIAAGESQASRATIDTSTYLNRLSFDYEPFTSLYKEEVPDQFEVYFLKRHPHGSENDTERVDSWDMDPYHKVNVFTAAGNERIAVNTDVGTTLPIWDDHDALVGQEFPHVVDNQSELQRRAHAVAARMEESIKMRYSRLRRKYAGFLFDVLPGSQISRVVWHDFTGSKATTEIMTRAADYKPLRFDTDAWQYQPDEKFQPPDFNRKTHPSWPNVTQLIKVDYEGLSTTTSQSVILLPNSDGMHDAVVMRINDEFRESERVWLRFLDCQEALRGQIFGFHGDMYEGRRYGLFTSGGITRPLYVARRGPLHMLATTVTEIGAATDLLFGVGFVALQRQSPDANILIPVFDITGSQAVIDVANIARAPIDAGKLVFFSSDHFCDRYVTVEPCDPKDEPGQ